MATSYMYLALRESGEADHGGMAERFKAAVLKTASPARRRGFESLSLRQKICKANFTRSL
jgi:hypothetical protein